MHSPRQIALVLLVALPLALAPSARAAQAVLDLAPATLGAGAALASATGGPSPCALPCSGLQLPRGGGRRAVRVAWPLPQGTLLVRGELRSAASATAAVPVRGGADAVAIALAADGASTGGDSAVPVRLQLVVADPVAPEVRWTGADPATGLWQRGPVCGGFAATDVGLGVDRVEYAVGAVTSVVVSAAGTQTQPRPTSVGGTICLDTAQLSDGVYGTALSAVDTGADGNRSPVVVGLLRIDNTAPGVTWTPPADAAARRPVSLLRIDDTASGVAAVTAAVDGIPAEVAGDGPERAITPSAALGDGAHALVWTAVDAAGNTATGTEVLEVSDVAAPVFSSATPTGSCSSTCVVRARAIDAGSGVDPTSWRLAVDGVDVTGATDVGTDGIALARAWAPGRHGVRAAVADRSGNIAVRAWSFEVPPAATPPSGIRLRARRPRIAVGADAQLAGTLPRRHAVRVAIEVRVGAGWRQVTTVRSDARGRFVAILRAPAQGAYTLRARADGARSAPVVVVAE